jgi:hypothetical protein
MRDLRNFASLAFTLCSLATSLIERVWVPYPILAQNWFSEQPSLHPDYPQWATGLQKPGLSEQMRLVCGLGFSRYVRLASRYQVTYVRRHRTTDDGRQLTNDSMVWETKIGTDYFDDSRAGVLLPGFCRTYSVSLTKLDRSPR